VSSGGKPRSVSDGVFQGCPPPGISIALGARRVFQTLSLEM